MLCNYQNYYVFSSFVQNGSYYLKTSDITSANWRDYYKGLFAILQDGIETDFVKNAKITVDFGNNEIIKLSPIDLCYSLIVWRFTLDTGGQITGEDIFFPEPALTKKSIKKYYDRIIEKVRDKIDNKLLNNMVDDSLKHFIDMDTFSFYIANTINLKDTIDLMNVSEEFNQSMHTSLDNIPITDVKNTGMDIMNKSHIDIIVDDSERLLGHDHCLRNSFISGQGIHPRQYKEFAVHIGSKPNGVGGIHPAIIDNSYLGGALNNVLAQYVDSAASRVAQIQAKNIGKSGAFARILGINNIDSFLYPDPDYGCDTKNFIKITIKNKKMFEMLVPRYYRLNPEGIDYLLTEHDTHMIGQTIYLRSPMTCASAAHGHGICYKCYGPLAYVNQIIKPGKFAAEQLSSILTQRQLSAKHLLEPKAIKINWSEEFATFFTTYLNVVYPLDTLNGATICINSDAIMSSADEDVSEEDTADYSTYINYFYINYGGNTICISSKEDVDLYFSTSLQSYIDSHRNLTDDDENIIIDMHDYMEWCNNTDKTQGMFFFNIENNELSKALKDIERLINKKAITTSYDKDALLDKFINLIIEGDLSIQSVHLEVILMNQICSDVSPFVSPDWSIPNIGYKINTLDGALKDKKSVAISLLYENIHYTLTQPSTYQKRDASCMDLFFMTKPQEYLGTSIDHVVDKEPPLIKPVIMVPDSNQ